MHRPEPFHGPHWDEGLWDEGRWDEDGDEVPAFDPAWAPLVAGRLSAPRGPWRRWLGRARTAGSAALLVALLAALAGERAPPGEDVALSLVALAFVPERPGPAPGGTAAAPHPDARGTVPAPRGSFADAAAPYRRLAADPEADGPGTAAPSLFVALARLAARADGLGVVRVTAAAPLATRHGPAETVAATLADAGGRARACAAFRLARDGAPGLTGLLCPGDRDSLPAACLLDDLVADRPARPGAGTPRCPDASRGEARPEQEGTSGVYSASASRPRPRPPRRERAERQPSERRSGLGA